MHWPWEARINVCKPLQQQAQLQASETLSRHEKLPVTLIHTSSQNEYTYLSMSVFLKNIIDQSVNLLLHENLPA